MAATISRGTPDTLHTVAAIHVPNRQLSSEAWLPPIGLQLPVKAFDCGGSLNMTTLQERINEGELPEAALMRGAQEEYNLGRAAVHEIRYLVSTRVPISPNTLKAHAFTFQYYHWHLLCTDRDFSPNPDKVKSFFWCCGPEAVFDYMSAARSAKIASLSAATSAAIGHGYLPDDYRSLARLKRCHDTVAA